MKVTFEIDEYQFPSVVDGLDSAVEDVSEVADDLRGVVDEVIVGKLDNLAKEYSFARKVLKDIQIAIDEG